MRPATKPSNSSPHSNQWTRPGAGIGPSAKHKLQGRRSSSPLRTYQGTNPPNPCYYSIWYDPQDAPELDAASYAALYDCPSGTWTFPVSTRDSWASSELDAQTCEYVHEWREQRLSDHSAIETVFAVGASD